MWWNWKRFHGLTTIFCFWYYYIVILNMLLLLLYLSTTNVRCIFVQSLSLTPIFTLCHFYCFYSLSHSNSLLFIFYIILFIAKQIRLVYSHSLTASWNFSHHIHGLREIDSFFFFRFLRLFCESIVVRSEATNCTYVSFATTVISS